MAAARCGRKLRPEIPDNEKSLSREGKRMIGPGRAGVKRRSRPAPAGATGPPCQRIGFRSSTAMWWQLSSNPRLR
jgi:hypothetical protein